MDESKKKRPRGRAPHGRFNVAKIWNEETGEWDEDPRTAPPAQGNVEAAEEEAALADLTSERDEANEKVARLRVEIELLQDAMKQRQVQADEQSKALQLMAIAQRPDLGINTVGVHPSQRHDAWWMAVLPGSGRFKVLNDCFQESLVGHKQRGSNVLCAAPQLTVDRIAQRFDPRELAEYNNLLYTSRPVEVEKEFVRYPWQRIQMIGDTHNEIFAWHGSKAPTSLERDGFDMRHVRSGKGLYGDGLYFSPHASKSDMYTRAASSFLPPNTAPKTIYLVRLNMGRMWEISSSERNRCVPPENRHTARAIGGPSANGHATLHDEYILYDQRRAHIAFRFTYRHADACRCAMCSP